MILDKIKAAGKKLLFWQSDKWRYGEVSHFTIAKYIIVALIAVFVVVSVCSNVKSTKSFEEVKSALEAAVDTQKLQAEGRKELQRYYGLNESEYDGVILYQALSGMSAEELLLVKASDSSKLQTVREAMEERKESRANDFSGYAPEETALVENSIITVKGDFILFVISEDAKMYDQTFRGSL